MPKSLLDTDTLSALLKQNPVALANSRTYLAAHGVLTFSIITRYTRGIGYDRIVPVSRGGSNTARNVELLCQDCSRAKGDRIQ